MMVDQLLQWKEQPQLEDATLVMGFTGWMDGGDVSTGTVNRLVDLLNAKPIASIAPDPFYIYNFPGSMELTALFRPAIDIEDGMVKSIEMPESVFYSHEESKLVLFVGKEPNLAWPLYGDCIFHFARTMGISRFLFIGSFGGSVPHTREPRLYVVCSQEQLLQDMEKYGAKRTGYQGPGSFSSYLMSRACTDKVEMTSLVVEIPGYLHGRNPMSIEAVTRRLSKILKLPLDLAELRKESTEWELQMTSVLEQDEEMLAKVHELEEAYDNELLEQCEDLF